MKVTGGELYLTRTNKAGAVLAVLTNILNINNDDVINKRIEHPLNLKFDPTEIPLRNSIEKFH